jgi:hypothetical protein
MTLENMLNLVGQHAGQLFGAVGEIEQAPKQDDIAARRGKRIDHGVIHHKEPYAVWLAWQRCGERGHECVEALEAVRVCALLLQGGQVGHHLAPQSLFPGHRNAGSHERTDEGDTPEVQCYHDPSGTSNREANEQAVPASTREARQASRKLWRHLLQCGQKSRIWHHQNFWNLATPLELDGLASTNALGLTQVGIGPRVRRAILGLNNRPLGKSDTMAR